MKLDANGWLANTHTALTRLSEYLNRMNVFPVADADTGTNMAGTLAPWKETGSVNKHLEASLLGAKGNSGTILVAWIAGFLAEFDEGAQEIDLAQSFSSGAQRARAVLLEPAEGTMLTVMDAVADSPSLALEAAENAVAQTAQVLRANQTAGTVDAGALGFLIVINELVGVLGQATLDDEQLAVFFAEPSAKPFGSAPNEEVEVMFDLQLETEKLATLRDLLPDLGNSASITEIPGGSQDGGAHVAVHIHTQYEKKVLKFAERLGTLANVRITQLHG